MNENFDTNSENPIEKTISKVSEDSIERAYYYAGFWKRFLAYLIDSFLITFCIMILSFLTGFADVILGGTDMMVNSGVLFMTITLSWIYTATMESSSKQATIGKIALGIIVTDLEGNPISFNRASGRYFGKIISSIIVFIGFLMAGFTEKKQALHDMMANCIVIRKEESKTFKNPFGHLRAGWRMTAYLIVLAVIAIPVNILMHSIKSYIPGGKGMHSPRMIVLYVVMVSVFTFAAYLTLKLIDKRPFRLLGLWFSPGWFREYYIGLGFGFGSITVVFLILWLTNHVDVTKGTWDSALSVSLLKLLVLFAFAGALEELMLRGYLFQAFIEGSNKWIAILVLSLIFSAMHMFNPNWSAMGAIIIFLAGIELSVAYVKTRSLWLPIGLHMAWNWTQGPLWGMHVSGTTIENTVLVSVPQGSEFWSGGEFGAEGSIFAAVITVLVTWIIWRAEWIKPSKANSELWKKYPASYGVSPVAAEI